MAQYTIKQYFIHCFFGNICIIENVHYLWIWISTSVRTGPRTSMFKNMSFRLKVKSKVKSYSDITRILLSHPYEFLFPYFGKWIKNIIIMKSMKIILYNYIAYRNKLNCKLHKKRCYL